MQIAIAVGALLLGGWVLETPEETNESAVTEQMSPSVTAPGGVARTVAPPLTPGLDVSGYQGLQGVRTIQHGHSLGRAPVKSTENIRSRLTTGNQAGAVLCQQKRPLMPLAPTENLPPGADTMFGQPAVPTAPANPLQMNASGGGAKTQGLNNLIPPTERPPAMPLAEVGYNAMSRGLDQSRSVQATNSPSSMAPPVQPTFEKPLAGYHPVSGVSPYMALFRTGTDNGTVDNYTTLVKPQLDQRYSNQQQYGRDISGLQTDTRFQGQSNQSRQVQSASNPQFFMNYGGYYNFSGSGQGQ